MLPCTNPWGHSAGRTRGAHLLLKQQTLPMSTLQDQLRHLRTKSGLLIGSLGAHVQCRLQVMGTGDEGPVAS